MSRNTYRSRQFVCECGHQFVSGFWAIKRLDTSLGTQLFETRADVRCPKCGSHKVGADNFIERVSSRPARLRESLRPVVYRWHDAQGNEHYRYPATNDPASQRASEERVEFDRLSDMERFLKEQNPGYRDWQVPLNDILDYDNPDTAINDHDPGAAEDMEAIESGDGGGLTTEREIDEFMRRDDARALIESL